MFPVDLPPVDETDLRSASESCLLSLESGSHQYQFFETPDSTKVKISSSNVQWLQLFEDNQSGSSILALHAPYNPTQVVALNLAGRWWSVDHVTRTSCKTRTDLLPVQSLVERLIMFLLSRVLDTEAIFSPHPRTERAKLLWLDGQAVGFYTVKNKGSLCDDWSGRCYLLPVLDSVLVRKNWRRRGLGLKMLADFCSSYPSEEALGVSVPLSASMAAVCRRFLQMHEDHRDRLYEVEAPGGWAQRRNIWLNIQLCRYSLLDLDHQGQHHKVEKDSGRSPD